jgi:cysteine desulfurase
MAMGVAPDLARGAVRVSFGVKNTSDELNRFLAALQTEVQRLRQLTAVAV